MAEPPCTVRTMLMASIWTWLEGITADEWTAAATWLTAIVAATAAIVAKSQLKEARDLRRDQAEATLRQIEEARRLQREEAAPYVVVYCEENPAGNGLFDLIIKNVGRTVATDIRVTADPPLERAAFSDPVRLPDVLPVLVPGGQYRSFWDMAAKHYEKRLVTRHEISVTYADSQGEVCATLSYVLDWDVFAPPAVTAYGMHDAAKALREMNATLKHMTDASGLTVWARDGDARQQRIREDYQRRQRAADGEG